MFKLTYESEDGDREIAFKAKPYSTYDELFELFKEFLEASGFSYLCNYEVSVDKLCD